MPDAQSRRRLRPRARSTLQPGGSSATGYSGVQSSIATCSVAAIDHPVFYKCSCCDAGQLSQYHIWPV